MSGPAYPRYGPDARKCLVGSYVLFYRVHTDDFVEVIRVRHQSQENDELFGIHR